MSFNSDIDHPPEPDAKPAKGKTANRRRARSLAMQALYQWHMADQSINEIEAQFRVDNDFAAVDGAYFHEILHGVPAQKTELDDLIRPCLDRALDELDPVELAKVYGATDGHKFVNGVLDKLAPQLREAEVRDYKR